MKRPTILNVVTAIILMATIFILIEPIFSLKTVYAFADNHTLSRKGHTTWAYIFKSGEWYIESPIETTLKSQGNAIDYNWVSYQGTEYSIFNRPILYGHGRPNQLALRMRFSDDFSEIRKMTPAEQVDIYNKLVHNDKDIMNETMKRLDSNE